MARRFVSRIIIVAGLTVSLFGIDYLSDVAAGPQDEAQSAIADPQDIDAKYVFNSARQFYESKIAFSAVLTLQSKRTIPAGAYTNVAVVDAVFALPGKVSFQNRSDGKTPQYICDGQTINDLLEGTVKKAPTSIKSWLAGNDIAIFILGVSVVGPGVMENPPLFFLLHKNLTERVGENLATFELIGKVTLNDVECYELMSTGERVDVRYFIECGDAPKLHRIVLDQSKLDEIMFEEEQLPWKAKTIVSIDYEDWKFDDEVDRSAFDVPEVDSTDGPSE